MAVLLAAPAAAIDGVKEINQVCAVQTGCFAGDTPGYPVTIDTTAGSAFRLTSRLVVPDASTDGIVISTNDVSIDLNNFSIVRSGCEGATASCKPASGSGHGITGNRGHSVKNGSILGMGANGVQLGDQAEVQGLRVRWNRQSGIAVGVGSLVSRSSAFENGILASYPGISVGQGSTVSDCVVRGTLGTGILTGQASIVSGSVVEGNLGNGIDADNGSVVTGNSASLNGFRGIESDLASTVKSNTAYDNGSDGIFADSGSSVLDNSAAENGSDGIATTGAATVQGNTVRTNASYGLELGAESAYRLNVISNNSVGTVTGGVDLFTNACDGSTSCP